MDYLINVRDHRHYVQLQLLIYKKTRLVSINHSTGNRQLLRMRAMEISAVKTLQCMEMQLL